MNKCPAPTYCSTTLNIISFENVCCHNVKVFCLLLLLLLLSLLVLLLLLFQKIKLETDLLPSRSKKMTRRAGPGCSKLTASLVNVSLNFSEVNFSNMPICFVEKM